MDDCEWNRWKLYTEHQSDHSIHRNPRHYLCITMDDQQWYCMYPELRSGKNKVRYQSTAGSSSGNGSNVMFNECDLSGKCTDHGYRNLDDIEWGGWKLCKCQQSDYSLQWCHR